MVLLLSFVLFVLALSTTTSVAAGGIPLTTTSTTTTSSTTTSNATLTTTTSNVTLTSTTSNANLTTTTSNSTLTTTSTSNNQSSTTTTSTTTAPTINSTTTISSTTTSNTTSTIPSTIVLSTSSCLVAPINGTWQGLTPEGPTSQDLTCEAGRGFTIPSGMTLRIESGYKLNTGEATIQGTLDNSGVFGGQEVSVASGGVIDNSGEFDVGPGSTLSNSGTIDTSNFASVDGTIINTGTISNSGGFSTGKDATVDNSGTFVTSGPGLNINGVFSNTGLLDDQAHICLCGGTINNQLGGSVKVESGAVLFFLGQVASGSMTGTINNHGTLDNYGTNGITTNETFNNYGVFNNFDTTGIFGTLNNNAAATVNNAGYLFNNCGGVINNVGTMTGNPTIVESCKLASQQVYANITVGSASTEVFQTIGLNVSISGTSGTAEIVASQLTGQPTNTGGLSLQGSNGTLAGYYDLAVTGIMGGTAHVCISNANVVTSTAIDYYSAGSWVQAANMTATPGVMVCGDISVSALSGSPFAVGGPQTTSTTLILGGVAAAVVVAAAGFLLLRRRR